MYTPQNVDVYLRAFAGCMGGLTGANVTDQVPAIFSVPAKMADAYAQQLDTDWGVTTPTQFELFTIQTVSEQIWATRSTLPASVAFQPTAYATVVSSVIARVEQANAQVVAEGIDPNAGGGSGSSFYQTVEQDTFTLPQQPALNFADTSSLSNNADSGQFDVEDNPANGSTDVAFLSVFHPISTGPDVFAYTGQMSDNVFTISAGPATRTMPPSTNTWFGQRVRVNDAAGIAATQNITINASPGQEIENPYVPGTYVAAVVLDTNHASAEWELNDRAPTLVRWNLAATNLGRPKAPVIGNAQAIDNNANITSPTVIAAFPFKPTHAALMSYSASWTGNAPGADGVALKLEVLTGVPPTVSGGTVVNGVSYPIGGAVSTTSTGSTVEALTQTGVSSNGGAAFVGGATVSGLVQLVAGTTYVFRLTVTGTTVRAYTNMLVNVALREL